MKTNHRLYSPSLRLLPSIVCLLLMLLTSCEKDAPEIDLSGVQEKLVVNCFISPQDTALSALVMRTLPLGTKVTDENPFTVTNAIPILSDGTHSVQLVYKRGNLYQAPIEALPIEAGKTYYLTVTTPEGLSASASCTVPLSSVPVQGVKVDSTLEQQPGRTLTRYSMSFDWLDEPGKENYYIVNTKLWCKERLVRKDGTTTVRRHEPLISYDNATFADDKGRDGQRVVSAKAEAQVFDELAFSEFTIFQTPDYLVASLWNTDVHLYQYQLSRQEYTGDNPFTEPQNLYTNVTGGLGIFGAYNRSSLTFQFP